jgi:hypothetical protein
MSRRPVTWLASTSAPNAAGQEILLLGKATFDQESDLLTVRPFGKPDAPEITTQVGGHPLEALAKSLLRELFRKQGHTP